MVALQEHWPEPVVCVQSLSESGTTTIPSSYVKPPSHRPSLEFSALDDDNDDGGVNIPVIDLSGLLGGSADRRAATVQAVSDACKEWGFFQVVNHGVSADLVEAMRGAWREFFRLPLEQKQAYANSPRTYEGFGSRLGVDKDVVLDWCDYFFLHLHPPTVRSGDQYWPSQPSALREITEEYGRGLFRLGEVLLGAMSASLGLEEGRLRRTFGGDERISACMRVNLYPRCPQPDLTLGLSPHSDPGGLTVLLADDNVDGLQVRKGDKWVAVRPLPGAFVVNIGDQIQVVSNAIYRSVDHRVTANSEKGRLSVAFFFNPDGDVPIGPAEELVTEEHPPLYPTVTFNQHRVHVRKRGPRGKSQMEALEIGCA